MTRHPTAGVTPDTLSGALVWLRRDLRVDDHAALHHALRHARRVWCAFVFDRTILDALPRADRRVEFLRDSLAVNATRAFAHKLFFLGQAAQCAPLATYAATVDFLAPDTAFVEAKRNLPTILHARGHPGVGEAATLAALDAAADIITAVPARRYASMRSAAMARIGPRDPDDWPVLACALLLNCPIWTEDRDFFGVGVPIWTTARVEVYFTDPDPGAAQH